MPLNQEQQTAVESRGGHILCVSAPGSGKTKVNVQRVLSILRDGVPPAKVLSVTFTKEAAAVMSNRAAKALLGVEDRTKVPQSRLDAIKKDRGLDVPYKHHVFCTFHSYALRFIKANRHRIEGLQDHVIASGADVAKAIWKSIAGTGLKYKDTQGYISRCKRGRILPELAKEQAEGQLGHLYAEAYRRYEYLLRQAGVLDFDSLLTEMARLLEENPDVRAMWQPQYLQIDEAQDTDAVQWRIVELISERHGNVFVVGDENQWMYGFRGGEGELEKNFKIRFPDAKVLILPENYRSSGAIIEFCKLIAPFQNETVKKFRTSKGTGEPVEFRHYSTEDEEAKDILDKLTDPASTAILARTNAQLVPFENLCAERGLKFMLLGKSGFWHRPEVESAMAYARCIVAPTDHATLKVIKSPFDWTRSLGRDGKEQVTEWLKNAADHTSRSMWSLLPTYRSGNPTHSNCIQNLLHYFGNIKQRIQGLTAKDGLQLLFERAGILSHYDEDDANDPDNDPVMNLLRLLKIAEKASSFQHFVEYADRAKHAAKATKDALTLSTVHQAKGLEWPIVHVIGVNQDTMPHKSGDPVEEQCIFYVACSRPEKRLVVSCSGVPSPFIADRVVRMDLTQDSVDILEQMYRMAAQDAE